VPIPETTINEIRQHADIVSIIGQYVRLRQRGKNFVGLCPFHTEKTPSFNVSPSLGIYKCFGCGKSGDVFTFLREYAGMSFTEAVYHLARQLGISIPEDTPQVSDAAEHRRRLIACLEAACTFFRSQADQSPEAKKFFRERMLPESVIKRFRLGYAPAEWTATSDALQKQGFSRDLLIETGLSIRRDDGTTYDRFRHRIMFPITNHTGVVIGFGGRYLGSDPDQPKYINTPQTVLYDKSATLFALDRARHAIIRQQSAFIVEGYMDALALHGIGVEHTVATSGTALTEQHIEAIRRLTDHVVFVFDGDRAGRKAAQRALALALRLGIGAEVVLLPEGEDPDSIVRTRGADAARALLERRLSPVEFLVQCSKADADWSDSHKVTAEIRTIVEILAAAPDVLYRELLLRELSDRVGVRRELLQVPSQPPTEYNRQRRQTISTHQTQALQAQRLPALPTDSLHPEEVEILRAVLFSRSAASKLFDEYLFEPSSLLSPIAEQLLSSLAEYHRSHNAIEPFGAALPKLTLPDSARQLAEWLIFSNEEPSDRWSSFGVELDHDRIWLSILDDALTKLEDRRLEATLQTLSAQLASDPSNVTLLEEIARVQKLRAQAQKRTP
jgi:DNA primase